MELEILQKEKEEWSSKCKQFLRMIDELETTTKEAISIMCEKIYEPTTHAP
jgi:predicted ribonuclease YlaK